MKKKTAPTRETKAPAYFDDVGKLAARLMLGGLLLFHGWHKLFGGIAQIVGMITGHGLPPVLAYGVYVGEVAAPALLLLGVYTRLGGLLVAANMVVAVLLVHTPQLFTLAPTGGWALELQGFYFFGGLVVFFLGAGRFSPAKTGTRWN